MFRRTAEQLEEILSTLPRDRVSFAHSSSSSLVLSLTSNQCCCVIQVTAVREKVNEYIRRGGVQLQVKEKTTLQKGIAVATGKALPSEFSILPSSSSFSSSSSSSAGKAKASTGQK